MWKLCGLARGTSKSWANPIQGTSNWNPRTWPEGPPKWNWKCIDAAHAIITLCLFTHLASHCLDPKLPPWAWMQDAGLLDASMWHPRCWMPGCLQRLAAVKSLHRACHSRPSHRIAPCNALHTLELIRQGLKPMACHSSGIHIIYIIYI